MTMHFKLIPTVDGGTVLRHVAPVTHTSERTAEFNASADAITALSVGDGVSVSLWTDVDACTITKKTPLTMTLRCDNARLLNRDELRFSPGGFLAHCDNQELQRYEYTPNLDGNVIKITLRRWKDAEGNERRAWKRAGTGTFERGGTAYVGRRTFHDFNF